MKPFITALQVEITKVRKSSILWITIFFFMFIASMTGVLMFVQKYPEVSGKMGMIGNKAAMMQIGEPNWANYYDQLLQVIAGVGLIGTGFVASWVFGREFSDRTIKDLMALPVSRSRIVLAKFIVILLWTVLLSLAYLLTGFLLGYLLDLSDWSATGGVHFVQRYSITMFLTALLVTPTAYLATFSKGIILPVGLIILMVLLANFSGMVGLAVYFPWAIPGVYAVSGSIDGMHLSMASYATLVLTSLLGYLLTWIWWKRADLTA